MTKKVLLRLVCMVLIVSVLLSGMVICANAAMTKNTTKRVIGIMFDNSGSMYLDNNTAWSQALYAMEVFASMMNEGDEFIIYPMHPITIGKNGPQYTSDRPYSVKDVSSAKTIRNIYSPKAAGTPGKATMKKALSNLQSKSGEKWLIVLTDGEFDDANLSQQSGLIKECLKSVNVLYLAIGKLQAPKVSSANGHIYLGKVASNSAAVPDMLTQMCNKVFGRDELPSEFISGNGFTVDIPMSKVYVFVQGKNISNVKLSGNGKVYKETKTLNPFYGTNGGFATADKKVHNKYDTSLQGCLVVYENLDACKEGEKYTIQFDGSKSSMNVYYEPDVNLMAQMINPDGTTCMEDQIFTPGDYNLKYFLADENGREVNSKLLGKTNFAINYKLNGETKTEDKNSAGKIPIHLDNSSTFSLDSMDAEILSGYKLHKSGDELGFLSKGIKCKKGSAGNFKINLTGGKKNYDPDTLEENAKYKATFTYNGEKLSGAEIDNIKFNCQVPNSSIKSTATKSEDGFEVVLSTKGSIKDLKPGGYTLSCSGTYSTETAEDAYAREDAKFELNDISGKLSATIVADKSYYVLKNLPNEKIILKLSLNGKPLNDEQLKDIKINADTKLPYKLKMLPGQSAYEISFDTSKEIKTGDYQLGLTATNIKDRLGNDLAATDSMDLSVGRMARWLLFLIWLLAILALLALLWYICTRTALPKKFEEVPCKINYLGQNNDKNILECSVSGNRKEKNINYSCYLDKTQTVGVTFNVVPAKNSYWIKPSAKRTAMIIPEKTSVDDLSVTEVKPYGGTKIQFEKGEIPSKVMNKLSEADPELFDCDGKFKFAGQTRKGRFNVEFEPEIK